MGLEFKLKSKQPFAASTFFVAELGWVILNEH